MRRFSGLETIERLKDVKYSFGVKSIIILEEVRGKTISDHYATLPVEKGDQHLQILQVRNHSSTVGGNLGVLEREPNFVELNPKPQTQADKQAVHKSRQSRDHIASVCVKALLIPNMLPGQLQDRS